MLICSSFGLCVSWSVCVRWSHVCGCNATGILRWCRTQSWMMAFAFTEPAPNRFPSGPISCTLPTHFSRSVYAYETQILLIPLICVNDCHWHCWQNCLRNPCCPASLAPTFHHPLPIRHPFPVPGLRLRLFGQRSTVYGLWSMGFGLWLLEAKFYERSPLSFQPRC